MAKPLLKQIPIFQIVDILEKVYDLLAGCYFMGKRLENSPSYRTGLYIYKGYICPCLRLLLYRGDINAHQYDVVMRFVTYKFTKEHGYEPPLNDPWWPNYSVDRLIWLDDLIEKLKLLDE